MLVENESSLHILNYNSPGATGAMPFAANIVKQLIQKNIVNPTSGKVDSPLTDEA
jgi:L-2-hydroxyglutarate oxidase